MPIGRPRLPPNLKRPESIRVMVSRKEMEELQKAADQASMPISVYVRATALEVARRQTKAA